MLHAECTFSFQTERKGIFVVFFLLIPPRLVIDGLSTRSPDTRKQNVNICLFVFSTSLFCLREEEICFRQFPSHRHNTIIWLSSSTKWMRSFVLNTHS